MTGGAVDPASVGGYIGDAVLAGIAPDKVGDAMLVYTSNAGRPVSEVGRAFVGTGKTIGKDAGLSVEDREAVAARENKAALQRTATASSISAGASMRNKDRELEWERERFGKTGQSPVGKIFMDRDRLPADSVDRRVYDEAAERIARGTDRPVVVGPGSVAIDPRSGQTIGSNPRPDKPDTPQTVAGAILAKKARGETLTPAEEATLAEGRRSQAPLDVSQGDLDAIEWRVLGDMGALSSDGKSIDPGFVGMHKDRLDRARAAMAREYQRTRNAHAGALAYLRELGAQTGDRYQPGGGWWLGYDSDVKSGSPRMERNGKRIPATPRSAGDVFAPPPVVPAPSAPSVPPAPAPAIPRVGATPPRPASVPPGSQYSPSRRMWRDPQGNVFDENGGKAS
jgi:hypothetical protein